MRCRVPLRFALRLGQRVNEPRHLTRFVRLFFPPLKSQPCRGGKQRRRIPFQMHHGELDTTVPLSYEVRFDSLLTSTAVEHQCDKAFAKKKFGKNLGHPPQM